MGWSRLVRVPSLYVVALWHDSPSRKLVHPLAPAPRRLEARDYDPREFLGALAELAHGRRRARPGADDPEAPGS